MWTGGCWFELEDVIDVDPGCTSSAPRACGTACIANDAVCAPGDVAGVYAVLSVNGSNDCPNNEDWVEGQENGPFTVTNEQMGADVQTRIDGLLGAGIALAFGGEPVLLGTMDGDVLTSVFVGAATSRELACVWTWRIELDAVADGDVMTGTFAFTPRTNTHPVCETLGVEGCRSILRFNATRSPTD